MNKVTKYDVIFMGDIILRVDQYSIKNKYRNDYHLCRIKNLFLGIFLIEKMLKKAENFDKLRLLLKKAIKVNIELSKYMK